MNILVTNDDGIQAQGIGVLAKAASRFGKVTVVAPARQCSAMSHRITLGSPMRLERVEFPWENVTAYSLKRVENLSYRLNRDIRDNADFTDKRKTNGRTAAPAEGEMDLEARVRWLTHQLEYTRQEVEFLKKLQMANTEARKQWESKHQPK